MARIAVGVEYDGGAFHGWQLQPHSNSVQETLQSALSQVAAAPITLSCAGRTDAGVHARAQVAHFDSTAHRSPRSWLLGANAALPASVSLRWVQPVSDAFHARYGALRRSYRYLLLNRPARSALAAGRAWCVHRPLEAALMQTAADLLVGEHDFSAFRAAECQARTPVRRVESLRVRPRDDWVQADITANAFLHHMGRNIVGPLVAGGLGDAPPRRAGEQLQSRQRRPSDGP